MKKGIALVLAVMMFVGMAACGNEESTPTESSGTTQTTTGSTENLTDGTEDATDATQEATETPTEKPTEAPTEKPTEKPTEAPVQSPAACNHNWNAATCTAAKTCTKCGATEGKATGHSWNAATCTAPKTCKTCKTIEGKTLGHSWKAATCTVPKTCKTCKVTEGKAAGHSWSAATCTAPKTCKTCKVTKGSPVGHTWKDASCTAPKTCSVCQTTEGNKLSHNYSDSICAVCESIELGFGKWYFIKEDVDAGVVYLYYFQFSSENNNASIWAKSYKDETQYPSDNTSGIIYNGKRYFGWTGAGDPCYYEATDNEITIHSGYPEDDRTETVMLERIAKDQMIVTNIVDDFWLVEEGMIFTYDCITFYGD